MTKLNFSFDEASLLKAYRISTLEPTQWEDVDHETANSIAGALTSQSSNAPDADGDPLGLGTDIDIRDLDMESKASILLSSKSFDPKVYLSTAHPNATYQDLASGVSFIRRSIDSRAEAIRILVEDNFDRFVAVKASTDALYTQMKEGLLSESTEYASKTLKDHLKLATVKADQVFLPILENASKAQKVRSTLGVFERSKFFFNLPGSLQESFEAGRYEVAMRDYKKGRVLLDSKPGDILPARAGSTSSINSQTSLSAEQQQKRVFDKVWGAVEKVMGDMRNTLISQLKEPSRTVEEQEKTIEILLELNVVDDPVWIYFDSQHKHILNFMRSSHERFIELVNDAQERLPIRINDPAYGAAQLQPCVAALETKQAESIIAKANGWEVWEAVLNMVKNLSEIVSNSLPNFWKIAKLYMEGKFKKSSSTSGSKRSASQCHAMALDIIRLYIDALSEFFSLSDPAVAPSPGGTRIPSFVPQGSNSLSTAHYLGKILTELGEFVNDITAVDLSSEATSGLRNLLDIVRWKFQEVLCDSWLNDARILFHLETWELNPEQPSTTLYLVRLHQFQKHNTIAAYKIAGGFDAQSTSKSSKAPPIRRESAAKIQKAFLDSIYAFLDGLVRLASDGTLQVRAKPRDAAATAHVQDISNSDTRLLLALSNLSRMSSIVIPNLMDQLESLSKYSIAEERATLLTVVSELDKTLFDDLVKSKSAKLSGIMRQGILESGVDWYETPRPTDVRKYMYEALMFLVEIHARIISVAPPLLERTMHTLVSDVVQEALACFRQIKRFGMGGMLKATLEIEFMHQTLVQYVTPSASATLTDIYQTISAAYSRKAAPGAQQNELQRELEGVKKTLQDSRAATRTLFLCFKAPKKEDKEKDKERSHSGNETATSSRSRKEERSARSAK